jgi:hypothetical protein
MKKSRGHLDAVRLFYWHDIREVLYCPVMRKSVTYWHGT